MADTTPNGDRASRGQAQRARSAGREAQALEEKAKDLPRAALNSRELSDLQLLANSGFSPLDGFMSAAQYKSVVDTMHLPGGCPGASR
jgi:ATP sulfurylase